MNIRNLAACLGLVGAVALGAPAPAPAQAPAAPRGAAPSAPRKADSPKGIRTMETTRPGAADEAGAAGAAARPRGKTARATFGGGCFWCLEAVFERLPGVYKVVSGYAGGAVPRPTYEQVCSGQTGHAEVVQIEYDPAAITYEDLLDVFFSCHDPTTLNRQGPDEGTQYRSVIFAHDEGQAVAARRKYDELTAANAFGAPIVTQLEPLTRFWPAEAYHQDYYRRHPNAPYCRMMIAPKLHKLGLGGK